MIHIIDDDTNVREGFSILLKSLGYESRDYESGELFLSNSRFDSNDIIILDIHLSGMNGLELLERLNKQNIHLPVIIVTAYDNQETRLAAKKHGALAYFRKPVDGEALIDIIKYNTNLNVNHKLN